jgi:hypothetical protein
MELACDIVVKKGYDENIFNLIEKIKQMNIFLLIMYL